MEFLRKYLLLLFLIANMTAEYILFMSVSKYLFYATLGLSIFFLLSKKVISPDYLSLMKIFRNVNCSGF